MGYFNNALFSKLPSLAGKLGGYSAIRRAGQAASQKSAAKEQLSKIEWLPDALRNAKIDKERARNNFNILAPELALLKHASAQHVKVISCPFLSNRWRA